LEQFLIDLPHEIRVVFLGVRYFFAQGINHSISIGQFCDFGNLILI
jgi:hypothetical protein